MILRKLFGLAGFALLLVAPMPAFAGQDPATPAPVPALALQPANCGSPALALTAPLSETMTPATPAATVPDLPDFMTSKRLGYCHCGCSSVRTCRTSADCGGASCDQFISCC